MAMVGAWIEAMRLRTLPVSVTGVLMAWVLAVFNGQARLLPAVLCLLFAVICQIASNFANEYYDFKAGRDRKGRQGPRRGVTEGDITPRAMKRATFALLFVAAAVGLSLTCFGGLWLIAAGILIGLGALAYSTGPYPLSTHCLGEVAVIFFFGIIPVSLTYYVQTGHFPPEVLRASLAIGLMGANVLITNNYRDIPDDRQVGKNTLATKFGPRAMLLLYWVNALAAVLLTLGLWTALNPLFLSVPVIYLVASAAIVRLMSRRRGASLTPCLGMTSMAMFFYVILFGLAVAVS